MPNVVRFALPTAQNLYLPGVGQFIDGILDVDANRLKLVQKARYLVQPYRAVEIGTVDASTPKPTLPGPVTPAPPNTDPYPQYQTQAEADARYLTESAARAASVAAVEAEATVEPTGQWDFDKAPTVNGVALGAGGGSVPDATTTVKGIVELATTAETTTGTDTVRAVTPAGVKAVLPTSYVRVAIWNGTNYLVNGTTVTAGNRVAGTFYKFLGGPDPNALGLMADGDEWKDAA